MERKEGKGGSCHPIKKFRLHPLRHIICVNLLSPQDTEAKYGGSSKVQCVMMFNV